uniref:Uncharacterized protein n=1 Tax=Angiostrongylus cantonensis TaxID=6313 RepID=A0A0K0DAI9_ANGCA
MILQARRIKYDVIGVIYTRRLHLFNAVYEIGELLLGTCESSVNTSLAMNNDSFEQLTTGIKRLEAKRCGSLWALTIFVVYVPRSSNDEDEIEAFYMSFEKFYRES